MELPLAGITGIGIDIEPIERWSDPDPRLFTERELSYCQSQARPAESFAGRWCAKEAVVKAFGGVARVGIREVEILAGDAGEPVAVLPAELTDRGFGVLVSIAHDATQAIAVAAVVNANPPERA